METIYRLLYCIVKPFFCLCHPVRAIGRENIPEGALVLCANHTALTDPLFVCFAAGLRYQIRPMAKIELSRVPLIGWARLGSSMWTGATPMSRRSNPPWPA